MKKPHPLTPVIIYIYAFNVRDRCFTTREIQTISTNIAKVDFFKRTKTVVRIESIRGNVFKQNLAYVKFRVNNV